MRLPTIHPVAALTHLKIGGDGAAGASTLPISEPPTPHRVDDTSVQEDPVEASAGAEDSGVESESLAPPSIPPSSPAPTSPGSSPGQEETQIDWNNQWSLGIVNPPQMTDTASG